MHLFLGLDALSYDKFSALFSSFTFFPSDFSQKPFNQSNTNATFGSAPFVPQPTPYPNFQGTSKKMDIPNGKVLVHVIAI